MQQRLPAEWEAQSAVQLTWPRADSDWDYLLDRVQPLYLQLATELLNHAAVVIAAAEQDCELIRQALAQHPYRDRLAVFAVAAEDTWARDHGPLTVVDAQGPTLLDFTFNGWGNKFEAVLDNGITAALVQQGAFPGARHATVPMVLEGGAIEVDEIGTLLTTESCLLNPNRNPTLSREQIDAALCRHFGVSKINWLKHGYLAGDDTDSHIDTLARLCSNTVIAYVRCDDPSDEHYAELSAMEQELKSLTNARGEAYQLVPLPWPGAKFSADGERLPATYANFLITNGAVLVPVYDDPHDQQALDTLAQVFPDRRIIGLNCLPLIEQHGSLHCITMQLPAGVTAS